MLVPMALTVEQSQKVRARARAEFDHALAGAGFVLNGVPSESIRREMAWAFYRIAMQELDGVAPEEACMCDPRCVVEEVPPCTEPK